MLDAAGFSHNRFYSAMPSLQETQLVYAQDYGEEMVVYESLEDAVEKCNFYLSNQEVRGKIARKGRQRVLTEYNMVDKIRYMMDVAEV